MSQLIEVAFGGNRKAFFRWDGSVVPKVGTPVIVAADRGEDMGRVHSTGELAQLRCKGCSHGCSDSSHQATDLLLRIATDEDTAAGANLKEENSEARLKTNQLAKAAGLHMKITDAEWQWDRKKLTIYFTAEKRIDFRTLVRDLASMFRTRIELRQIGVRDEAKRLSGIGRCGREYCSASWLPDLRPVNLGVAKDQRLSLNPTQISGACGRLMCCLRYEHDFYVQSRRRFPKEGRVLRTSVGEEKVISSDIFRDTVTLRSHEGEIRTVALTDLRSEVDKAGGSPLSAFGNGSTSTSSTTISVSDSDDYVITESELTDDSSDLDDDLDEGEEDISLDEAENASEEGASSATNRRRRKRGRRGGKRSRIETDADLSPERERSRTQDPSDS